MLPETRKLIVSLSKNFKIDGIYRPVCSTFIVKDSDDKEFPYGLIISRTDGHKLFEKRINDELLFKAIKGNMFVIVNDCDKKTAANNWTVIEEIGLHQESFTSLEQQTFTQALSDFQRFSFIYKTKSDITATNEKPDLKVSFNIDYLYALFEAIREIDDTKKKNKMITLKLSLNKLAPIVVNDCAVLMPMRS